MNQNELAEYFANMKRGSSEWYLYHHIKNEEPIIPLIVLSCFLAICHGGIFIIILIWAYYFSWAKANNEKLNNDPYIQQQRIASIQYYLSKKR